jgi:hypothetical protein
MLRVVLAAALAALLTACVDDAAGRHNGPPPHDPADYHGVPTDDRPPMMIDNLPPAK